VAPSKVAPIDGLDTPGAGYDCGGAIQVVDSLGTYYVGVGLSHSKAALVGMVAPNSDHTAAWVRLFDASDAPATLPLRPASPAVPTPSPCDVGFTAVFAALTNEAELCTVAGVAGTPCEVVVAIGGLFLSTVFCTDEGPINVATQQTGNLGGAMTEEVDNWHGHIYKAAWDWAYVRSVSFCLPTETVECYAIRTDGQFVPATMHWVLKSTWPDTESFFYFCAARAPTCINNEELAYRTDYNFNYSAATAVVHTSLASEYVCPDGESYSGLGGVNGCTQELTGNTSTWHFVYS